MFIEALVTTIKKVEATQVSNMDEWLNKCGIYKMEYYPALKKFGYMLQQWMNLENIDERSQTQKDKYCSFTYMRCLE